MMIATLDRRLRYFGIHYINYNTPLAEVCDAVKKELDGPGRLLGYRAMNHKLTTEHNVQVPWHLVHDVMPTFQLRCMTHTDMDMGLATFIICKTRSQAFPYQN